jgi:hypothetical protein
MLPYHHHFVAWDALPLHPHELNDPLTVRKRKPNKTETSPFGEALRLVAAYTGPRRTIAVGGVARKALKWLDEACVCVRHPSHGGQTEFAAGMQELFGGCS